MTNAPQNQTTATEMTLTPRQERQLAVRDELAPGSKPAAIIPRNFLEAQQLCQALAASSLVPKAYRTGTGAVDMLLVVMTGSELGIPPMAALRLFTTWDGVPRLMAEGVRSVLVTSPDIEYFEMSTCDEKHATWIGKRRGRPEKSVTWTIERARRAGLADKDIWKKYPDNMLNARASMELGRILAPDIISGMRSLEEVQDEPDFIDAKAVERKPEFAAPPHAPATPTEIVMSGGGTAAEFAAPAKATGEPAPKAKTKAKSPEPRVVDTKVNESPASTEAPKSSPASSESTSSAGAGSSSTAAPGASSLSTAIDNARARDAERAAAPTTPSSPPAGSSAPPASASPAPSGPPAATETSSSASAVTTPGTDESDDDAFGEDPFGEDPPDEAPKPSGNRLADFFAELQKCMNQRELSEVGNKWRAWSRQQAESGDKSFGKNGENAAKMGKMYATRKAEVPA